MRFEYLEPVTIEETVSLLTKYGEKAKVVAGGTDLLVQMRKKVLRPQYVVDIKGIAALDFINYDDGQGLRIGTLTTIRALEKSAELRQRHPVISQAASLLGSFVIRNIATLGGNLCNAAPSAETAPALIGMSARAKIIGPDGERTVPIEGFFTGPGQTVLKTGELLVEIQVPPPMPNTKAIYLLKHGLRGTTDPAIVGVGIVVTAMPESEVCQDAKIVLGAVAPTPMRATEAEKVLKGKRIDDALIKKVAQAASEQCCPIFDVRASAEYRGKMVEVFTKRALRQIAG